MTAEQLVVLLLLAAAFAAGWVARGAQGSPAEPLSETSDQPGETLARALTAYRAARSTWAMSGAAVGPAGRIAVDILRARVEEARAAATAADDGKSRRDLTAVVNMLERAVDSFDASLRGGDVNVGTLRPLDALAERSLRTRRTSRARTAGALGGARRRVRALLSR
jgi:hypothetical protein